VLMKTVVATLTAILLTASAAFAENASEPTTPTTPTSPEETTAPTPATDAAPEEADANDPVICKREAPRLGSRVGGARKVCRKASEWRDVASRAQSTVNDAQSRSLTGSAVPKGGGL
jgi:hypothetical protein